MLSIFCSPSRYTQGRNATASLGQEIVNLGLEGPALIVAGKSAIAQLSGVWQSSLHAAGLTHSIFRFGGECSPLEIERGKAAARQSDARIIIGAGGGKVLDTARAVASDLNLPVVNCPTVASSDAPCSALSVGIPDLPAESRSGSCGYGSDRAKSGEAAGSRHGGRARDVVRSKGLCGR